MLIKHSHRWWYYVLAILLFIATVLMLLYSPFQRANALVASGVVIAAVLAALAAIGITTVVSGMTSAQVQDYIDGKLSEWATSQGSTVDNLIQGNLITKTATNLFAIGAVAANGIRDFIDWLITDEDIVDDSETNVLTTTGTVPVFKSTGYDSDRYNSSTPIGTNAGISRQRVYLFNSDNYNYNAILTFVQIDTGLYIPFVVSPYYAQLSSIYPTNNGYSSQYSGYVLQKDTTLDSNNTYYMTPNVRRTNIVNNTVTDIPTDVIYNSFDEAFRASLNPSYLQLSANTIDIYETVANDDNLYIDVGATSVSDVDGLAEWVMDKVIDNNLSATYEVADAPPVPSVGDINVVGYDVNAIAQLQQAIQSAIESAQQAAGIQQVEIKNESPIQVITDPLILGFTLPSFDLRLNSIWYYVSGAINETSAFISFFVGMLNSVSFIYYPLYMGFVLMIVLGVYRRFLH